MGNVITNHGTKILGTVITILGGLFADPTFSALLGKWGAPVTMVVGGLLTVLRGFNNSSNQAQQNPTAPK